MLNCWYYDTIGKGGNLTNFTILYHHCPIGEFLQEINDNFSFHQPLQLTSEEKEENLESKMEILSERTLSSFTLKRYVSYR